MISSRELEARVREMMFRIRRPVDSLLHGAYSSKFHGGGLEFAELREYAPGDEVRHIEWNASARIGRPFTKQHVEERNLQVMFVVDVSGSAMFRAAHGSRLERLTELVGLLGLCAARHRDRCGLLLATDQVEEFLPPATGLAHVRHMMEEVLRPNVRSSGSDLRPALRAADSVLRRRGLVFVLSDFLVPDPSTELAVLADRHQVAGIECLDPLEVAGPSSGLFRLLDPESGRSRVLDARDESTRRGLREGRRQYRAQTRGWFERAGGNFLSLISDQDAADALHRWFHGAIPFADRHDRGHFESR